MMHAADAPLPIDDITGSIKRSVSRSDWRELRERVERNKRSATFEDLARLLEAAGFVMGSRTAGSHRAFRKPGCPFSPTLAERRGSLPIGYVMNVLRAVDECADE
jgi:predicted RNA binding protein YcfA (HicA-like mRNA interferase family)